MTITVDVSLIGLSQVLDAVKRRGADATAVMPLVANFGAKRAVQIGSREIRKEVAFKKSYLDARLKVRKFATELNPVAEVSGRGRATSLAQFAQSKPVFGKKRPKPGQSRSLTVMVAPGKSITIRDAFFVRLKRGTASEGNIGIASRGNVAKRNTENPKYQLYRKRKKSGARVDSAYYLRYGPSVDQVFTDVRSKISPRVLNAMEVEFFRQLNRR